MIISWNSNKGSQHNQIGAIWTTRDDDDDDFEIGEFFGAKRKKEGSMLATIAWNEGYFIG